MTRNAQDASAFLSEIVRRGESTENVVPRGLTRRPRYSGIGS
jgi:hypothetical protein